MTKTETVTCDICGKEVKEETSKSPNHVRYYDITPIYSGPESMMYSVYIPPTPPEVWCTSCMKEKKK